MSWHNRLCLLPLLICLLLSRLALASEPVDTNQFGFIDTGMSEAEVLKRLGEPARVLGEPRIRVKVHTPNGIVYRERRRYTYYYPGTPQIMDTYIMFEDGQVVKKEKKQSSGRR